MAKTAYEMLGEVKKQYTGARELFVIARLSLKTGLDLNALTPGDADEKKAQKLRDAIRDVCPNVTV